MTILIDSQLAPPVLNIVPNAPLTLPAALFAILRTPLPAFIPNFLTEKGKDLILSRENEFIFLMLIFGQVRLLQSVSKKLEFKLNSNISKIRDKFFD